MARIGANLHESTQLCVLMDATRSGGNLRALDLGPVGALQAGPKFRPRAGAGQVLPGDAQQAKQGRPRLELPVLDKRPVLGLKDADQLPGGRLGCSAEHTENKAIILHHVAAGFTDDVWRCEHFCQHHARAETDHAHTAGELGLQTDDALLSGIRSMYQERRDVLYEGLRGLGIELRRPKASFYLWAKVPRGFDSSGFAAHLLEKAGVLATPGNGFGAPGEGYIRFALTVTAERTREAVQRITKVI